jgi:hypothetical protein
MLGQGLCTNGKVDLVLQNHADQLLRGGLVYLKFHPRIVGPEDLDGRGQNVTGLGMGCANPKYPTGMIDMFAAYLQNITRVCEGLARIPHHLLTHLGKPDQAFAVTKKQPGTNLLLQPAKVLGDGRLDKMQLFSGAAHAETVFD